MPSDVGLSGYINRTGQSLSIRDLSKEQVPFEVIHYGSEDIVRSVLAVPLRFGKRTIGMLSTQSYKPNAYRQHDLHLLQSIADHVAIGIENAYLYTDLQKRYHGLQEREDVRTEVIQNVSHELRNPLTYLTTYIDLLLQDDLGSLNESQRNGLMVVKAKTATLVRLVEDITTLETKPENWLRVQDVDLLLLARHAVASLERLGLTRSITIELLAPPSIPTVQGDPDRISEVFDNLLGNALKFSPTNSKIVVRLESTPEYALVSVADQGEGIPNEEREQIFKRFYQVESSSARRHTGLGLGLAIVKHIVDAHQGKVWVESEPGVGSTFYFALPYRYKCVDQEIAKD